MYTTCESIYYQARQYERNSDSATSVHKQSYNVLLCALFAYVPYSGKYWQE